MADLPGSMEALAKTSLPAPACTMVIFGANGDLTKRLLMPALYNLAGAGLLDDKFGIVGVDREDGTDADFQGRQKAMMESFVPAAGGEFAESSLNAQWWSWLSRRLHYKQGDFTQDATFAELKQQIGGGNAIFYLAVADRFFSGIIDMLHKAELTKETAGGFRRVVIEKPFGHDLVSAQDLNSHILSELDEKQIHRIDHFLGKETVQNIMALRFGNGIFESLWSRDHIDSVQITASETVGVEKRGKFYEVTGALRDMVPNHIFQLLSMIAMEPPLNGQPPGVCGGSAPTASLTWPNPASAKCARNGGKKRVRASARASAVLRRTASQAATNGPSNQGQAVP